MRLFSLDSAVPLPSADVPAVSTPLGDVRVRAAIDGAGLPDRPGDAHEGADGARVFGWDRADARVELLLCRPRLHLPPGMAVTDCRAAMWRIRATAATGPLSFACAWDAAARWLHAGPETGEGLDAQTWSDGRTRVTAGTADGELLRAQAQTGLLPRRWITPGGDPPGTTRYAAGALAVSLPGLEPGERCQVHFTVAWGPEGDDAATWFAVDCAPGQVLAGAGLSG